eukprot:m.444108 g.444108  ORF g.444108 m.444108 type:complete len:224 (+) comp19048_c0_seq1:27-698(+)
MSAIARRASVAAGHIGDELASWKENAELLSIWQHNLAVGVVAGINTLLLIIAFSTNAMIQGTPTGGVNHGKSVDIGFWTVEIQGVDKMDLCSDFPSSSETVCSNVRAARGFCFMAIFFSVFSVLGAAFREITKREAMPWKSVLTLLTSGIFAACSYGVWMGGVNADLNDLVKKEFFLSSTRYWNTTGFSNAVLLWAWIHVLVFLCIKVILPGFDFHFESKIAA